MGSVAVARQFKVCYRARNRSEIGASLKEVRHHNRQDHDAAYDKHAASEYPRNSPRIFQPKQHAGSVSCTALLGMAWFHHHAPGPRLTGLAITIPVILLA
jgi:hypothetical protein